VAKLGVNIDHVATVRQARGVAEPDPVTAAALAELAGADGITVHLREDRRHIQDRDVELLRRTVGTRLNLEMAATDEMVGIALKLLPDCVTLVPEKREELTTEGGLDVIRYRSSLKDPVELLRQGGITVSLFVDPDLEQIGRCRNQGFRVGSDMVPDRPIPCGRLREHAEIRLHHGGSARLFVRFDQSAGHDHAVHAGKQMEPRGPVHFL
jgi:pyridoxine 5-phosphate synthase